MNDYIGCTFFTLFICHTKTCIFILFIKPIARYFKTKRNISLKTKLLGITGLVKGTNNTARSKDQPVHVLV